MLSKNSNIENEYAKQDLEVTYCFPSVIRIIINYRIQSFELKYNNNHSTGSKSFLPFSQVWGMFLLFFFFFVSSLP